MNLSEAIQEVLEKGVVAAPRPYVRSRVRKIMSTNKLVLEIDMIGNLKDGFAPDIDFMIAAANNVERIAQTAIKLYDVNDLLAEKLCGLLTWPLPDGQFQDHYIPVWLKKSCEDVLRLSDAARKLCEQ